MHDRFRFRVWAGPHGHYLTPEHGSVLVQSDGTLWINIGEFEDELTEKCTISYITEQCTGLKDKNGVLIYEGDIVKHHVFRNGYIGWDIETASYIMQIKDCGPTHQWQYNSVIVIGNIHENPELLEQPCSSK